MLSLEEFAKRISGRQPEQWQVECLERIAANLSKAPNHSKRTLSAEIPVKFRNDRARDRGLSPKVIIFDDPIADIDGHYEGGF